MPLYNNGNNIDEESWLPPQSDKQRNRISQKPSTDDLHYFMSRNSKEEMAYMYSKMMAQRNGGDKVDYDMDYDCPEIYEMQVGEVLQFFIDPQEMVIMEAYYVLSEELGIHLDGLIVKDLYEYSMWHPNAIVCHVCRKIDWTYDQKHFYDAGTISCNACKQNTRQCPEQGRRLDINFETFLLPNEHDNK